MGARAEASDKTTLLRRSSCLQPKNCIFDFGSPPKSQKFVFRAIKGHRKMRSCRTLHFFQLLYFNHPQPPPILAGAKEYRGQTKLPRLLVACVFPVGSIIISPSGKNTSPHRSRQFFCPLECQELRLELVFRIELSFVARCPKTNRRAAH